MGEWILIFWLTTGVGGEPGIIPFPTENACRNAGEKIRSARSHLAGYICVPRNV